MMKRRLVTTTLAVLLAAAATLAARQDTMSKEMTSLQGAWMITSVDGQDLSGAGVEVWITITGDKYTQSENGAIAERGSLKIDASKKPMTIDLMIAEGQDAGATQVGVIEVNGASMRGKLNAPGATVRPTDFEPADGFFTFTATKK